MACVQPTKTVLLQPTKLSGYTIKSYTDKEYNVSPALRSAQLRSSGCVAQPVVVSVKPTGIRSTDHLPGLEATGFSR